MLPELLFAAAFIALTLTNVILTSALRSHRTDIPRNAPTGSGPSRIWQVNVFMYATYDARGRWLRRWALTLLLAQLLAGVSFVVAAAITGAR